MEWVSQRVGEAQSAEEAAVYAKLGELYEKKLWHELTLAVEKVVREGEASVLLPLLVEFVAKFEQKVNQLKYAQILCGIVSRCAGDVLSPADAIARLDEAVAKKRARLGTEASLFVEMEAVCVRLKFFPEQMKAVKEQIDAAKPTIDALTGTTDTAVFHKFYTASTAYYKLAGPAEQFYRAALSLLSYASEDDMAPDAKYELATDMSLAALTGDGVYNFGEVLATPILEALEGTPNAWLGELLRIFARGDVQAFATLIQTNRHLFEAQAALVARLDFLKEKISILAFLDLLFETPAHARTLPFARIADRTALPLDHVEWLTMRAMALGLVRGHIDQVESHVHVTWLVPKVLDADQIKHLIAQLDHFADKASSALAIIHDQSIDLL